MGVGKRYGCACAEVADCCRAAGRDPGEVTVVAVSKTVDGPAVAEAIEAGARDFGENRPDQLMAKADAFPQVRWHFIGNIQGRRIRDIVGRAALIHSLSELHHAQRIAGEARKRGIVQDALIEVNVSGEQTKGGLAPAEVPAFLDACRQMEGLRVRGLMTMAPRGDAGAARDAFRGLRQLLESLQEGLPADERAVFRELSMGMSEDWPEAVQEGATFVRIGRRIFSDEFGAS